MVNLWKVIEFFVGFLAIPFIISLGLFIGSIYFSFLSADLIYYGPLVLTTILGLILFRYRKILAYGLLSNVAVILIRDFVF